ncbi:tubulin tyrosine ligase 3-like isoform X1 [Manacus candei]|uniref:tubulin tyrosine ligase 3-like isoform X1 n=1 Tax=Manacus candei TaxID=415023 RepID=UPI002226C1B3|nr:tubulin tyrosine ligase 3-like isoform X1 [Manacus candei]
MSGAPSSVRERQTGQDLLPLPACPVGPVGSSGALLTGQVAAATTGHHNGRQRSVDAALLRKAKRRVEKAIKEKKIFAVRGPYPVIRSLLRARGWVERKLPREGRRLKQQLGGQKKQQPETESSDDGDEQGEAVLNPRGGAQPSLGSTEPLHYPWPRNEEVEEEKEEEDEDYEDSDEIHDLMSYLVRDQVPNFLWTIRLSSIDQELLQRIEVVNRYHWVHALSTKEGLCLSLQNLPWFEQADPNTFFPRCYRLGTREEREAFIEDFHLTAARSLLKLALKKAGDRLVRMEQPPKSNKGPEGPGSSLSSPSRLAEEALEVCEQHLGVLEHQDIDRKTPSPCRTCIDWNCFLQDYYRAAHEGAGLALSGAQRERCQDLLRRLAEQLPQFGVEGDLNIWILKPSAKSRGRGIVCATRLEEVLQQARSRTTPSARACEWVVQKYVERPLTIFGTKFDIRQWFLVTDGNPLTVWFYQDCYLRFCSQPFSLRHLEHSRHLCNVSVQKQYKASPHQDPRVPPSRVWSSRQFQAYLARLGRADAWHQVMVPGMKAAILNSLRCAQDHMSFRKGSFELFGADFLVGEDCQPWLLEINSCPTMSPSSAVTRRLCANVQRDTLRLVLDRKDDPSCPTGAFELIYKEAAAPPRPAGGINLMVEGCSLKKPRPAKRRLQEKPPTSTASAPRLPVSSEGRATQAPQPRVPQRKLPPLRQQSSCCTPSSAPAAPPQPPGCSAGSQDLPWLLHLVVQPQEAEPQKAAQPQAVLPPVSCHARDRVPVPPPQGAPSSPRQPPDCSAGSQGLPGLNHPLGQPQAALPPVSSHPLDGVLLPPLRGAPGCSAGSQDLPWLLHLVGQPEDAQPQEAPPQAAWPQAALPPIRGCPLAKVPVPPPRGAPRSPWRPPGSAPSFRPARPLHPPLLEQSTSARNRTQKNWDKETSPRGDSPLPALAEETLQHPAPSHPSETPLLRHGTRLNPHTGLNTLL